MKILYADDSRGQTAWLYARSGLAKAFSACGHEVILWDIYKKSAYDMMDEFEPDLLIAQTYNLERGIVNSIKERPKLKVILKGSDWSEFSDNIDIDKYPILRANTKEVRVVENLNKEHPIDFIFSHYHPKRTGDTHAHWTTKLGINTFGIPLAADISDYTNGEFREEFKSDVFFCGGYWPLKSRIIDKWLFPVCADTTLNIKIFGNKNWPLTSYCGFLDNKFVKHAAKSAKVCPNLHEPHAHLDGNFDLNERSFKLLSNKCPVISDYVKTMAEDFYPNGEIIFAKTPLEFREKIMAVINKELVIDTELGYKTTMDNHTYFHRASSMFIELGLKEESEKVMRTYQQIRADYQL